MTDLSSPEARRALLEGFAAASVEAGAAIWAIFQEDVAVTRKADDSPVTAADTAAEAIVLKALARLIPGVPVIAEEEVAAGRMPEVGDRFLLVDPLDGTKEFIKGTGEFTVNIALISGTGPVLGVVHVPVTGVTYWGRKGAGAFMARAGQAPVALRTRPAKLEQLVIVASKDHAGPRVEELLKRLPTASTANLGSSLKFCLIAEGQADFYPRFQPTCEWDTGAAQCVLEAAGGAVTDTTGQPLVYNKEQLLNPSFLAFGDPRQDWLALLA